MANFHDTLVLNKYILSLFGIDSIGKKIIGNNGYEVFNDLKHSIYEGYTDDGNTMYLQILLNHQYPTDNLTKDMLQQYDENIVRYTREISHRRPEMIKWQYFQYLSLLFTEIYLDKYFSNRVQLLAELNEYLEVFNQKQIDVGVKQGIKKMSNVFQAQPFKMEGLNKLAFWNATGSGKTLLMHINMKQYLHYASKYNQHHKNKVLLITPNEGLTKQHLQEFAISNIPAEEFSKKSGAVFTGKNIEILDIHKLAETSGDKTVAVDSFETDNLVLIDEGHGGMSGDTWKQFRDKLSETGFAFEYSATFGQAISAAAKAKRVEYEQEYGKSILFDYSYKYFYEDGYGKDYRILNLKEADGEYQKLYMTANLISFYQQQLIFKEKNEMLRDFLLHKPLWLFVGGSVNAVRSVNKKETSDVLEIIYFLTDFLKKPEESISNIDAVINNKAGLIDSNGFSIFESSFSYLLKEKLDAESIFRGINELVFNNRVIGANLYLDDLKGADGELGLRVGETGTYFGVINVGDERKLYNLAVDNGVLGGEKEFSESLFKNINNDDSEVNLLIGSKKFTEGWSSWRVSSMGLMNVGKSEGAQIIQLFGRGVRLKGYQFSLKRSNGLDEYQKPNDIREVRKYLNHLEVLQIFGVRANYMEQFKDFLKEEGLPINDSSWITIKVPTVKKKIADERRLKMLRVKDDEGFKRKVFIDIVLDTSKFVNRIVELDWYPKIDLLEKNKSGEMLIKNESFLNSQHLSMINWNSLYLDIQQFKADKSFDNIILDVNALKGILNNANWYKIYIPEIYMSFDKFSNVNIWQELAAVLLKRYVEHLYIYAKNEHNKDNVEVVILSGAEDNFIEEYNIRLNRLEDVELYEERVKELKNDVLSDEFIQIKIANEVIAFDNLLHLYKPLIYMSKGYENKIQMSPVALDKSEKDFLYDLQAYAIANKDKLVDREIHVLRNQSRKGIGFFADGNNFYPDFIIWIIKGGTQYIKFVDPKGIRNSRGLQDPKIQFHHVLKNQIEPQVTSSNVKLNSYIISNTSLLEVHWAGETSEADFNKENVYFQKSKSVNYVDAILSDTK